MVLDLLKRLLQRHLCPEKIRSRRDFGVVNKPMSYLIDRERFFQRVCDVCVSDCRDVTLELEGIDRMYLNVFVPRLQREAGVAAFFRFHRGHRFASSVLMDPISQAFVDAMGRFAETHASSCAIDRRRRRPCARRFRRRKSMLCCASGCAGCRTRSLPPIGRPATAMTCRFSRRSSRSRGYWIDR